MLLYDQVNMALVTGPAAMLFWMLLAVGDAAAEPDATGKARRAPSLVIAGFAGTGALVAIAAWLIPLAAGRFALDPAPHEFAYVRHVMRGDDANALHALNQAIALAPNSGELLMQRVALKRDRLRLPVADDIRQLLKLDRANARLRLDLALPDTDLPAAERVQALKEAMMFDTMLAPEEPKRLSEVQRNEAFAVMDRLSGTTLPGDPGR
jgi:hypothetical protein